MEKYVLTLTKVTGTIIYGFSGGILVYYHNATEAAANGGGDHSKALEWFFDKLPMTPEQLRQVSQFMNAKGRTNKLELIPPDTSFDAFWDAYGKKINRKRTEPLWKKLNEPERIQCILSIAPYDGYLNRSNGRAKMDPENYLKKEAYKNNWNALKN